MCPGLQEVNLSSSNIGDVGVTYLIEAIMENEELKELVSCRSSWSVVAAAGQLSQQLVSRRCSWSVVAAAGQLSLKCSTLKLLPHAICNNTKMYNGARNRFARVPYGLHILTILRTAFTYEKLHVVRLVRVIK